MKKEKTCCKCKVTKPIDEFFNHKDRPDGKQSVCKICSDENRQKRRMEKKLYGELMFIG